MHVLGESSIEFKRLVSPNTYIEFTSSGIRDEAGRDVLAVEILGESKPLINLEKNFEIVDSEMAYFIGQYSYISGDLNELVPQYFGENIFRIWKEI